MGRWGERLGNTLGAQGWSESMTSGGAGQVRVQQFQFIMRGKILRAVCKMKDVLLTVGEDKEK